MSNAYLSPILQQSQFDDNGNFLAGGLIWSYAAGTTTPQAVYTDSTAATAWPNPITLDARGESGGEIWLAAGSSYKFVLESAPEYGQTHGEQISVFDEVTGVNDTVTIPSTNNWIEFAGTPTYISGTSFSVAGDQRSTFQVDRRLKSVNSGGTIYSSILSRSYAAGATTVTVLNDTGSLDAGLSTIYYSFVETDPSSIPPPFAAGTRLVFAQAAAPFGWTQVTTFNDYALRLVSGAGGGSGGSLAFTTAFSNTGNTNATTLNISQAPAHVHPLCRAYDVGNFNGQYGNYNQSGSIGYGPFSNISVTYENGAYTAYMQSAGGGGSHTHGLTLAVNYVDVIICEKD